MDKCQSTLTILADMAHRSAKSTAMAAKGGVKNALLFQNRLCARATVYNKLVFENYCLENYSKQVQTESAPSELFADNFASFKINNFNQVESDTLRYLRDFLKERETRVQKVRNEPTANFFLSFER